MLICFWCKREIEGDHGCQETFEIMAEREMARDPEAVVYTTTQLNQWEKKNHAQVR